MFGIELLVPCVSYLCSKIQIYPFDLERKMRCWICIETTQSLLLLMLVLVELLVDVRPYLYESVALMSWTPPDALFEQEPEL